MSEIKSSANEEDQDEEDLITERDIDEDFGLFQEGSFPGALPDSDQKEAINHAIPDKHD